VIELLAHPHPVSEPALLTAPTRRKPQSPQSELHLGHRIIACTSAESESPQARWRASAYSCHTVAQPCTEPRPSCGPSHGTMEVLALADDFAAPQYRMSFRRSAAGPRGDDGASPLPRTVNHRSFVRVGLRRGRRRRAGGPPALRRAGGGSGRTSSPPAQIVFLVDWPAVLACDPRSRDVGGQAVLMEVWALLGSQPPPATPATRERHAGRHRVCDGDRQLAFPKLLAHASRGRAFSCITARWQTKEFVTGGDGDG